MATIVNDTDKRLAKLIQERDDLIQLLWDNNIETIQCC